MVLIVAALLEKINLTSALAAGTQEGDRVLDGLRLL
jgi:hypothetical protein